MQSIIEMQEATNEELQTPREELEYPNEELHTVNEEMQHRNDLLNQLNNDLTNLLNTVNLPMLMVGADLSVRRFTPQATAVLGLMPSDIGRPIPRLRIRVDTRVLEQSMLDVMQEVQPRHQQVQDDQGNWFSMRITPYRTLDNRIDGVVLTIVDRNPAMSPTGIEGAEPRITASADRQHPQRKSPT
jgi:two-component system CheB/CheR fusion protein